MSWETMLRIAEECGEQKIGLKVGNIEEPLLHPRMIDFVREARKRGVPSFHITSNGLPLDESTWERGRGWALWKAAYVLAQAIDTDPEEEADARRVLNEVLTDHASTS